MHRIEWGTLQQRTVFSCTAYRVDSECPMGSVAASIQGPTPYEMLYPSESAR